MCLPVLWRKTLPCAAEDTSGIHGEQSGWLDLRQLWPLLARVSLVLKMMESISGASFYYPAKKIPIWPAPVNMILDSFLDPPASMAGIHRRFISIFFVAVLGWTR